jgi:hypothetical protein
MWFQGRRAQVAPDSPSTTHRPRRRLHRVRLQTPLRLLPAATATATASARTPPPQPLQIVVQVPDGEFPAGFAAGVASVPSCIVM